MSTERLARFALAALLVGLALHNALLAQLWELGVRGGTLDAVAAWKEALLLVALVVVAVKVRGRGGAVATDVLAVSYTLVVVLYVVIPQDWLGGEATTRGELLALRHHLLPVAGYALGRLTAVWWSDRSRVGALLALVAAGVAVVGLVDLALVELQAWRESGVPGWYREQLGLDYEGLSGLPENWVHDPSGEDGPLRRLVSTFLSPNASAYAFVVGLVFVVSRPFRWWWALVGLLLYAGLLYAHALVAVVALALGLVVLTVAQRRWAPAMVAIASVVVAAGFFAAYPAIGPATSYTEEELEFRRENPMRDAGTSFDPFTSPETSAETRWRDLRAGVEAVLEHPQGYGLGNAGSIAQRAGEDLGAGESTYTELGIDTGIAGAVAFVLWSLALLLSLLRREPWVGAAFASVLLLGLWTNVVGVHWLAVGVWAAAGIAVSPRPPDTVES